MNSLNEVEKVFRIAEQERAVRRNRYWAMLKRARQEYTDLVDGTEYNDGINGFYYFMQQNYGIKIEIVDTDKIGGEHYIVDDQKYMLFLLKHGS